MSTNIELLNDLFSDETAIPDVRILTSGGLTIPAHSAILRSGSKVLEKIINRPRKSRSSYRTIPILGVPCNAVVAFLRFMYSSRCEDEEIEAYGITLLALSHLFSVPQLKERCAKGLAGRLTTENIVDVLQLSRLCDAPGLRLKCIKFMSKEFKQVQKTEGWKFLQDNDPWLELEILQYLDETESENKRRRKNREAHGLYTQLSDAMECLHHICTEGCTSVGPFDVDPKVHKGPCTKYSTCQGVQHSIRHFATCKKRVGGGCRTCKRTWQLLRLHSSLCDQSHSCAVPMCRQFKLKAQLEKRKDDGRWKLLARRVASAKVASSLSLPKQKESGLKLC
ncbi:hypothetical protein GIB67_004477 [Kingdonia uniflora]|uniref:BTB domain-containing protein n=1 Tax=Kingdonia uniflora TaxID=39325 RepID=A0A7J7LTZ0_9MAGN|nr:hypothetical protein GIB67_023744 [Kingdonia uniflora]KAF6157539.1 hypothetical protein GIB67_004477 [Kingdonia uniflora]